MSKKITCVDCDNASCFIKKHLDTDWLKKIELKKIQIEHHTKDCLFREGGYVQGVFFIQRGNIKIVSKGADNKEQIVRLASEGVLGHRGFGDDKYPISAVALSYSIVCFIDNDILYDVFINNPKFTLQMMEFYSCELRKTEIRMKYLMQMNVKEKIAEALLSLKEVFGINQFDKSLNVYLSRQEIAGMTGGTAEQITKGLGEFEKKKLIVKNGRKGIKLIDENGLREIVRKYGIQQYADQK